MKDDGPDIIAKKSFDLKMKEDEEFLRKRFTEQVRKEELRFKTWEQKVLYSSFIITYFPYFPTFSLQHYTIQLIGERDRLNKDLESHHASVKQLEEEIEQVFQASKA